MTFFSNVAAPRNPRPSGRGFRHSWAKGKTVIKGILIPPGREKIQTVELDPMSPRAFANALGGHIHGVPTADLFQGRIDVMTSNATNDYAAKRNGRARWFIDGGHARGRALIVGAGGTDVPPELVKWMKDQRLLRDEDSI